MRFIIALTPLLVSTQILAIEYDHKNNIHFGLNSFYRDYSEELPHPAKSDEYGMIYGVNLGYERKAPQSLLFSADLNIASGSTKYDGSLQSITGLYLGSHESTTDNDFVNVDSQLGYTFTRDNKHLFTPFIGLGLSGWNRDLDDYSELYAWSYLSAGLQYDYNANLKYQYGIHFKIMQMLGAGMSLFDSDYNDTTLILGNKPHFEVSAPIKYRLHPESSHYFQLAPYYQYQQFGKSNWAPTTILGVAVQEPASRTHIVGAKLQYNFGF